MKRCVIVCGYNSYFKYENDAYLVGVDKGALNLINNNLIPDLSIGDFDSISDEEFKIVQAKSKDLVKLNPIKDDTDLEHTLKYIENKSFDLIEIYGCLGGRQDHNLLNIKLLFQSQKNIVMYDEKNKVYKLSCGKYKIYKEEYKYFSIFTLDKALINSEGFKYPHQLIEVSPKDNYLTSNEILNEYAFLNVIKGQILVIQCKD